MRQVLAVTLAVSLGAGPTLAAQTARQEAAPPVFGTEVSLVLVPVFVVDGKGRAVRGLRAEDFSVAEDGQAAEIVSFRYVDTTDREEQEDLRLASAARRRFLLLFDKSFTDIAGLVRAQRAAREFVRTRLSESDLAAVATFDVHRGVRVVANFTEDRALLAHGIDTLGVPMLSQIRDPLGLALDLQATDIATAGSQGEGETPQALLDSVTAVVARQMRAADREQYRGHIQTLAASFGDLARGLRNVEGRKQILYFSAGFDSELLVGERGAGAARTSEAVAGGALWEVEGLARYGDSRIRGLISDATRNLAAADTVVHSVDVTGLAADTELSSMQPSGAATRENSGRESLNLLASDTGGRLFKDTNDLRTALDEMLEMTSRYYVLGVQPRETKGAGEFHKLKVRVARKGVRLSHRPGYYEHTPSGQQTPLQRQFEAAQLVMTGAGDAELRFASLCLPFPEKADRQTLGLVVQVPRGSLRWEPDAPEALELYGYAEAEDGRVLDHLAQFARVDVAQADPEGSRNGVSFFGTLSVPAGRYTLRLMLHERESGRSGFQFLDVFVPPYDPRSGFLLPPVLMDDPGRWVTLEMGRDRAGTRPYPFVVDGQPFLPRASAEVTSGSPERMVLIAYEPRVEGDPATDLQIWSSLTDRDGTRSAPGLIRIERVLHEQDGRRTYLLGYTPSVAQAGDYTLRVGVGEARSLLESYARLRVLDGGM